MAITLAQNKNTWNTSLRDSKAKSSALHRRPSEPMLCDRQVLAAVTSGERTQVLSDIHLLWQTWRVFWLGIHHSGSQKGFSAA